MIFVSTYWQEKLDANFQEMGDPLLFFINSDYSFFLEAGPLIFFKTFICTPNKAITKYRPRLKYSLNAILPSHLVFCSSESFGTFNLNRQKRKIFFDQYPEQYGRHVLGDYSQGSVAGTCFGDQSPSVYSYFASKF